MNAVSKFASREMNVHQASKRPAGGRPPIGSVSPACGVADTRLKVEYINPFVTSAMELFATTINTKLTRERISLAFQRGTPCEVSAQIGVSGEARGLVLLSFPEATAVGAASVMAERRFFRINDGVLEAVGKMANMIARGAAARMPDGAIRLTPPEILRGQGQPIAFPASCQPLHVWFGSGLGRFCVTIGLTHGGAAGAADQGDDSWGVRDDEQREVRRYGMRQNIEVTLRMPRTPIRKVIATALDVSSQSISFLNRGMVHCGTPCDITMTAEDGGKFTMTAKVLHSEYLKNSLHLVAAQFDEVLDLTRLFAFHEDLPPS